MFAGSPTFDNQDMVNNLIEKLENKEIVPRPLHVSVVWYTTVEGFVHRIKAYMHDGTYCMRALVYKREVSTLSLDMQAVNFIIWYQTSGSGTTSLAWTYIKVCGYSDSFCKNLNQRSLTPRWPLTPHLLRSYVWLYPRIIVSKSHENTSKYVDTVTFFAKTWSEGHWPLDDLWPHICWGHMCDSTQGSLCLSPMKIHQSMWIQWPFLQKLEPKVSDP